MISAHNDHRATTRFPLHLPVTLKYPGGCEAETQTRDVSSRGVCFHLPLKLEQGSKIEFTLKLPPDSTAPQVVHVRCAGRVVRVGTAAADGNVAIAARIDKYQIVRQQ